MRKPKLGAMGAYPRGKLNANDEGELRLKLFIQDETLMIDFGKELSWIGLSKLDAEMLGNALLDRAKLL